MVFSSKLRVLELLLYTDTEIKSHIWQHRAFNRSNAIVFMWLLEILSWADEKDLEKTENFMTIMCYIRSEWCCICRPNIMNTEIKKIWFKSYCLSFLSTLSFYFLSTFPSTQTRNMNGYIVQYVDFTLWQQFLPFFYVKSWSNITPNGSLKICSSWRFQSTPYMLNLMKFWPRYLRLKTIDIFLKLISFHLFHCQFSPLFLHWI